MYIMYCKIEINIVKNQSGIPGLGFQEKSMCVFFVLAIAYFLIFKKLFANNLYTRLKDTTY